MGEPESRPAKVHVPSPVWRACLWSVLVGGVLQKGIRQWPDPGASFWRGWWITSACCLALWAWSRFQGCRSSFMTDGRARKIFNVVLLFMLLPVLLRRLGEP